VTTQRRVAQPRLYDLVALLTVITIIALDQWTKSLVVSTMKEFQEIVLPGIGRYLSLQYIRNTGAAFSSFNESPIFLTILILVAIGVVAYLYIRMWNSGSLGYKMVFCMIIGGAFGNLIDRALRGGGVVDFIYFHIYEIGFKFAIFNVADASISVGVFLLFLFVLFGGIQRKEAKQEPLSQTSEQTASK